MAIFEGNHPQRGRQNDELPIAMLHFSCFLIAYGGVALRTQSIYRLWFCSKTVLPEYVSATGPPENIYICICGPRSLSGGALLNIQRVRCRRKTIVRFTSVSKSTFDSL